MSSVGSGVASEAAGGPALGGVAAGTTALAEMPALTGGRGRS
jgi:hypothetical protein